MECNKDEAIRSKSIAESKLEQNDFAGAIKFALRAQTLYPGMDGISQMLTTLDVHVSAENKINGEVDWYGVLRVDPTANDETIKKRYKKLALILHPDKNKSVGADGAFKLISEAKSLLLDKDKRTAYDLITGRQEGFQHKVPTTTHTDGPSQVRAYTGDTWARNNDPSAHTADPWAHTGGRSAHTDSSWARSGTCARKGDPSAESPFFTFAHRTNRAPKSKKKNTKVGPSFRARAPKRTDMFWTICHHCTMQFEYLKIYCNKFLICPNCYKTFMSLETPRPISKSRSHKPKPWPPHRHNSSYNNNNNNNNINLRTPNGRGKNIPDGQKLGTWETGPDFFAYATYLRGPLFGEPANAAYYTESDASNGMEGLFKKQKFNGLYGNNYNVPQGDVHFRNAGAYGFGCNVYVD